MIPIEVPGLQPDERAIQLETGDIVVVAVQRRPLDNPDCVALEIPIRFVQPDGSEVMLDGVPVRTPPVVRTIYLSGLVTGQRTIENEIADMTSEACTRAGRHIASLRIWANLPFVRGGDTRRSK